MSEPIWQPLYPCRPEVAEAIRHIRDALEEEEIVHLTEQEPESPDLFSVAAHDADGYLNSGLVGWSDVDNRVLFVAHDPLRAEHDVREGVSEEESKCFWLPKDADMMVAFLSGEVRQVMARFRAAQQVAMDIDDPERWDEPPAAKAA